MSFVEKHLILPELIRKIPKSFAWIDREILWQGYIQKLKPELCTLYLFLVLVADQQGLSFYSDRRICEFLHIKKELLPRFRAELAAQGLIAYQSPLYQLLALVPRSRSETGSVSNKIPCNQPVCIKDILKLQFGGAPHAG